MSPTPAGATVPDTVLWGAERDRVHGDGGAGGP